MKVTCDWAICGGIVQIPITQTIALADLTEPLLVFLNRLMN